MGGPATQQRFKGSGPVILAVLAPLMLALVAPVVSVAQPAQDLEVARLIDSTSNPLPILPIVVPQLQSSKGVVDLLAPDKLPTLFQISQPSGQYAEPAKVRFFQMLAVEYPLKISFRKVAAGSLAAQYLYNRAVTKPIYLLCDPAKSNDARCAFINEAAMPAGHDVKQTTIEDFIYKRLNISPTLLTTFQLTMTNVQSTVFEYQPDLSYTEPTAKWIVVLFFPGQPKVPGPINRLRALIALERFFYANRLRIAECDLSTAGGVYEALLPEFARGAIPTEPELWLINPATHNGTKYASKGDSPPIANLTHTAFETWLANNGVPAPPDDALNIEAAWQDLAKLDRQTNSN